MKGFFYSDQQTLFDAPAVVGFGVDSWNVKEIDRLLANSIIKEKHYSKKYYTASYIHLGVFIEKELKGVLQYGYAMNPASCGSVVEGTKQDEYLELNRMWLCDSAPRNSESKAISYSVKYIRGKYPKIKWIQSFADERCGGFGIVYQAASFCYYGEHNSVFWILDDVIYHNSLMTRDPSLSKSAAYLQENKDRAKSETYRQFRYIKYIDKRCKKKCKLIESIYPKHYRDEGAEAMSND